MNNKKEEKKSNARIAWDDFISNFSVNDKKGTSLPLPEKPDSPAGKSPVQQADIGSAEKLTWNFRDYDELKSAPSFTAKPSRTTVIGESVEIIGNCKIAGDVEIYGEIQGDVQAGGAIGIYGKVIGNISGQSVQLNAAEITGNVTVEDKIELDENSTLINGKLVAGNIVSNGKTECDMEISGIARFGSSARAVGHITTARISIEEGAIINGTIVSK